ncbi:MAG: LysE family transporter [Candidatus Atribacteria bacterium]|nr:LysE family transporter [Candidatus Atribacteria bacterium]
MFISFLLKAGLISLSGVMAPGPITAVSVSKGTEQPYAGAFIALGHGMVELVLIILVLIGFGQFLKINWVKLIIGMAGGLFLLKMGIGLLKNSSKVKIGMENSAFQYTPLRSGIVLSIANPYLLIWWATIGAMLIADASQFGVVGLIALFLVHWSCDFCWNFFLSAITFKGGKFFGQRLQQILFAVCGLFLLFFSGKFIYDAINIAF